MRIILTVLSSAIVGLLLISCGGSKSLTKDYGSSDQTSSLYPKQIEELMNKQYKESVKAVGFAGSQDLEMARKKANDDASDKIARQFRQELSFLDKRFQQELTGQKLEDYQSTTQAFGTVNVEGAQVVKETVSKGKDGYMVYALEVISAETFKKLIDDKIAAITELRATKAYKELDERVANEKAASKALSQ